MTWQARYCVVHFDYITITGETDPFYKEERENSILHVKTHDKNCVNIIASQVKLMNRKQHNKKILVAISDEKTLEWLVRVLENEGGFSVLKANNPPEAIKVLSQQLIDLFIVEVRLFDHNDENDTSGVIIAKEFFVPTIVYTIESTFEGLSRILRIVDGLPSGISFINASHTIEGHRAYILSNVLYVLSRQQHKVFVSYSSSDWEGYVEPLVTKLHSYGIVTWLDRNEIKAGDDWLDKLTEALEKCSALILCVTPRALESNYVKMEYRHFIDRSKLLIPLMCEETPLPIELSRIQYIQYSEIYKLIETLRKKLT